ncbi:MAG: hypothetical protein GY807_20540 [Gammaproteobacteria bacterium]|nr:hypothetical protein [Gammaproteobacteria bacterium]
MVIPFGAFEPDRTDFAVSASQGIKNAVPVRDGWGPLKDLSEYSNALPAAPKGATFVRSSAGAYTAIAGTAAGLYKLNTSTLNWDEISKSATPYNVADSDMWSFQQFGTKLVATNIGDPPQVYDVDAGGNFADLGGSPPQAKHVFVAGDFLVLARLQNYEKRIQWSGINDITHWTVGEKGADFQEFPDGGEIAGGIGEQAGGIIIQRDKMRYMQFSPPSGLVFTFTDANPKRGTTAPYSITQIGPRDFVYLSTDGFFRGVEAKPIGAERVDRWFLKQIDLDNLPLVAGVNDPVQKIVWWRFTDVSDTAYLLGYDWQLDRWCYADSNVSMLTPMVSAGTTLEGLDATYPDLDAMTVSLDSRLFKGGVPIFGGFTTDYKLGFFDGQNRAAELYSAQVEINPNQHTFVNGCRVYTDADSYTVCIGGARYHGESITFGSPVSPESRTGISPMRKEALLHQFKLNIAAGAAWDHAYGIGPKSVPAGEI